MKSVEIIYNFGAINTRQANILVLMFNEHSYYPLNTAFWWR